MYSIYLESINKTINYDGAITEKDLANINLSLLTDDELDELYDASVGYAETLIGFEWETRDENEE